MDDKKVKEAILKVALGYSLEEVTEEYGVEDGELRLVKRRETKKDIPPDLKAVKLLLEEKDYTLLSDEELEKERQRLLTQLKEDYEKTGTDAGRKEGGAAKKGARGANSG